MIRVNDERKSAMADKVIQACGGSVNGKRIAVLGVTFKPDTDDMRDAPSLIIVPKLEQAGANIILCDPKGHIWASPRSINGKKPKHGCR